jgi:hypothetical protein
MSLSSAFLWLVILSQVAGLIVALFWGIGAAFLAICRAEGRLRGLSRNCALILLVLVHLSAIGAAGVGFASHRHLQGALFCGSILIPWAVICFKDSPRRT